MSIFGFLTQELAIDLGTANTLIIHKENVVVDEPSIIAMELPNLNIIGLIQNAQLTRFVK